MAVQTAQFEAATISTYYQMLERGSQLDPLLKNSFDTLRLGRSPTSQEVLAEAMRREYPNMDYDKWYVGILRGAEVLASYLNHRIGSVDRSWKYAHYDGAVTTIPSGKRTDVINYIWDHFSPAQKGLFANKKDSWNTADVYMVKSSEEALIKRNIDKLLCIGDHTSEEGCLGVASVNAYLTKLVQKGDLLPISLKQATPAAAVNIKPTNMTMDPDGVEGLVGRIETPLYTNMAIIGFSNGDPSFDTNSLTFNASFEAANVAFRYAYESKVSSAANHATEPRDLVLNVNTQKYIKARARNGAIPAPRMAGLVQEYTGESINSEINLTGKLTSSQISYWKTYFKNLTQISVPGITLNFGGITIDGTRVTPENFIGQVSSMDDGNPVKGSLAIEFRSKLRLLRYMKMFSQAARTNKLGELLAKVYFLSAKVNFNQGDLVAPFIKIQ